MNKIIIVLIFTLVACTNTGQREAEKTHNDTIAKGVTKETAAEEHGTLTLNDGHKWKTDAATRKNVAALKKTVNDPNYAGGNNNLPLAAAAQEKVDILVKECKMQGADHDALHLWLGKVLQDIQQLKKEDESNDPVNDYQALKKDVDLFDTYFE